MIACVPIQIDFEGLYFASPKTLKSVQKNKRASKPLNDLQARRRDLLKRAIRGDEEAIRILKVKYRIKSFIHRRKVII